MKIKTMLIISLYLEALRLCEEREQSIQQQLTDVQKRRKEIQPFLEEFDGANVELGDLEVGPDGPTLNGIRLP